MTSSRRWWCSVAFAVLAVGGFTAVLVAPLPDSTSALVSNLWNTALLAWLPLAAAARRCRRAADPMWRSWALLSAGVLSWGAGQVAWAWYEEVRRVEVPFPSVADVGYLGLPLCAVAALVLVPAGPHQVGSRLRALLDASLVATSAGLLSWVTVLGTVYRAGADSLTQLAVGLAYPLADLMVAVLVLLVLVRAQPGRRLSMALLAAAFAVLVVGDGAFLHGVYTGWYATGGVVDLTWTTAFSLLVLAAAADATPGSVQEQELLPSRARSLLPYVALVPAVVFVVLPALLAERADRVEVTVSVLLLALLMARQLLSVSENHALVLAVAAREAQLRHQAFHDPLTGLANRALFAERVSHAAALARRDLRPLAVLYVDLDDFKPVNDTFGHAEGDRLLVAVAERLRGCSGPADTIARLGGDEFALLLEDPTEDVRHAAARVAAAMTAPFYVAQRSVPVSASIGAASVAGTDCLHADAEHVLRDADAAMYAAKRDGGARWVVYDPSTHAGSTSVDLRGDLVRALDDDELALHYQPVVDLAGGRVVGVEALLRWTSPTHGVVPADRFVPIAEQLGLMPRLGRWVAARAVEQTARWLESDPGLAVHVNVSPLELAQPDYRSWLLGVLAEHGVAPRHLVLEVTERALAEDEQQVVRTLAGLRAKGVRIAADDFGTGWASLAQLRRLPVDIVKIDSTLLAEIATHDHAEVLVEAILRLGVALDLEIVAEGVEDEAQLAALERLGCGRGQGFLLGRPVQALDVDVLGGGDATGAAPVVVVPVQPGVVQRRTVDRRAGG